MTKIDEIQDMVKKNSLYRADYYSSESEGEELEDEEEKQEEEEQKQALLFPLTPLEPATVADSEPVGTWTPVQQAGKNRTLSLKPDEIIRFRESETDEWTSALVVSRAGKVSGTNKNLFNVQLDSSDEPESLELGSLRVEKFFVTQDHTIPHKPG